VTVEGADADFLVVGDPVIGNVGAQCGALNVSKPKKDSGLLWGFVLKDSVPSYNQFDRIIEQVQPMPITSG